MLELEVDAVTLAVRTVKPSDLRYHAHGTCRAHFGLVRSHASTAESGASPLFGDRP